MVETMSPEYHIRFCPICGTKTIPNAKFCVECGYELKLLENTLQEDETPEQIAEAEKNFEMLLETQEGSGKDEPVRETSDEQEKEVEIVRPQFSPVREVPENTENNFNIIRPNSNYESNLPDNSNNESNLPDNSNKDFNLLKQDTNIQEPMENIPGLECPNCGQKMHKTTKTGILSGGTYHNCSNCQIEFRENNDFFTLLEAAEHSRLQGKLKLKRYTYNEWQKILSGEFTSDESDSMSKWQFDSQTSFTCPICSNHMERYKQKSLHTSYYDLCPKCTLILEEHKDSKFTLYNTTETYSPLWRYQKKLLSLDEIHSIVTTEETSESRNLRKIKINEREKKFEEYKRSLQQKEDDLALFENSLLEGNPLLPVPDETTIVLKKNERPVYRIDGVSLSEPRAVRTTSGGYGGTSVRIAKGVTLHGGRTASKSESHDEIKIIDSGELLITNQRLIFLGANRTTNIDLKKIIAITSDYNQIQIQRSNKQKAEYFSGIFSNPTIEVNGRNYTVEIDGEKLKKLIIGLVE